MIYGIIAGVGVAFASVVGSIIGLIFKKISHKQNDIILGFASGVMLAAAFLGLLPSAFSLTNFVGITVSIVGIIVGAIFISLMDKFLPHLHFDNEELKTSETKSSANRMILLIIAIAIHNIPEGLATGIVFGNGVNNNALLVTLSMVIQKIPEGLIVIIPMLSLGMKKSKAFIISILVASMMLPGVIVGVLLGNLPQLISNFFYAFTFGAIAYVVSDEIIPQSHLHGFQRVATFSLIVGIIMVAVIQYTL